MSIEHESAAGDRTKFTRDTSMDAQKAERRQTMQDHDLLIRIDTQMEIMREDLKTYRLESEQSRARLWAEKANILELTTLATRVGTKADKDDLVRIGAEVERRAPAIDVDDHEKRLRHVERWMWVGIGAVAVVSFLMNVMFHYGLPH